LRVPFLGYESTMLALTVPLGAPLAGEIGVDLRR
jgi:hypothetical protein